MVYWMCKELHRFFNKNRIGSSSVIRQVAIERIVRTVHASLSAN
jgi:hypothetical protein